VLCLHDELLVQCPEGQAEAASALVGDCLREAAQRWAPGCGVRFISDTSIVRCWSQAKTAPSRANGSGQPERAASAESTAGAKSSGRSSGVK
jgi:hypothetical protein